MTLAARFIAPACTALLCASLPHAALAQGFEKVNTTVLSIQTILITISVAVVTIAIIWAGFRMLFQAARLADVAHVLIATMLIGGANAMAALLVG